MSLLRRFGAWLDSPLHLLLFLCSLIPIGLVLVDLSQNAGSIPLADEWENAVVIAIRTAEGALSPADLFRQHFEHRLVLANLITALSTVLFNWNLHFALILNFIVVVISFVLVITLFSDQHRDGRGLALALIPFALLLFSLRQRDLWLWSGQLIGYSLAVVFLLAGLWYARRAPVGLAGAIGAALACIGMSLSVLQGFLGWFAVGTYLALHGYWRQPRALGVFAGLGLLTLILYSSGFNFALLGTNALGQSQGLATNLNNLTGYVFAFLGSPFVTLDADSIALATFATLVGLVLIVWNSIALWRAGRIAETVIWLILIGFAISAAILTGLGNAHVFPDPNPTQPLTGRYTPFASLFWIGAIALGVLNLRRWQAQHQTDDADDAPILPPDDEQSVPADAVAVLPFDEAEAVPPAPPVGDDALPPVEVLAQRARPASDAGVEAEPAAPASEDSPAPSEGADADPLRGLGTLVAVNVIAFLILLGLYLYVVRMQPAIAPLARQTVVDCLLDFPRSRNLGCMRGIAPPRLDTVAFTQRISRLAINRLTAFQTVSIPYTGVIELSRLVRSAVPVRYPDGAPPRFEPFDYGNGIAGLTLITVAPTQVEFPLTVPQTSAPVFFRSAGIIDRRTLPADAALDGVIFRIAVSQPGQEPAVLLEAPYDPITLRAFTLLEADLSAYRGQSINLILQVGGGEQPADNVALWLDPIVEVRAAGAAAP
jgi:hypothetical protein